MRGRIIYYQVNVTLMTVEVTGSKFMVTDNIFRKCIFRRRHGDRQFTGDDHLGYSVVYSYNLKPLTHAP